MIIKLYHHHHLMSARSGLGNLRHDTHSSLWQLGMSKKIYFTKLKTAATEAFIVALTLAVYKC